MLDKFRTGAKSFGVMLIFGIIIVVFVFWGVGNYSGSSSRTLAEVNGSPILIDDFQRVFGYTAREMGKTEPDLLTNPEKLKKLKQDVMRDLMKQKLIQQAAEEIGIIVTPQERKMAIQSIQAFHDKDGNFSQEVMDRLLASERLSFDALVADVTQSALQDKLFRYIKLSAGVNEAEEKTNYAFFLENRTIQYVLFSPDTYKDKVALSDEDLRKDYDGTKESYRTPEMAALEYVLLTPESLAKSYPVSDAEAEAYYKQHQESFRQQERVLVRHIFVPYPIAKDGKPISREDQETGAREVMEKAQADLAAGNDFTEVAQAYTQGQASTEAGQANWLQRGDVPLKEFEDAAFSLQKGETSGIVATMAGMHIIKVEDKEEDRLPSFEECKADVLARAGTEKATADLPNVIKKAEDSLALGTSLAETATQLKAEVQHTGKQNSTALVDILGIKEDSVQLLREGIASVADSAASGLTAASAHATGNASANATTPVGPPAKQGRTIPVPLNVEKGIILVRVDSVTPAAIPPFENVRDLIDDRLRTERAAVMAREEAEKALPSFKGKEVPEAFKDKTASSKGTRAFALFPPLGNIPGLSEAVFSSTGEWLPQIYDTKLGTIIARCELVEEVTDNDWARFKDIFMPQRLEFRGNEMLAAFLGVFDDKAKIKAYPDLLDALRPDVR